MEPGFTPSVRGKSDFDCKFCAFDPTPSGLSFDETLKLTVDPFTVLPPNHEVGAKGSTIGSVAGAELAQVFADAGQVEITGLQQENIKHNAIRSIMKAAVKLAVVSGSAFLEWLLRTSVAIVPNSNGMEIMDLLLIALEIAFLKWPFRTEYWQICRIIN